MLLRSDENAIEELTRSCRLERHMLMHSYVECALQSRLDDSRVCQGRLLLDPKCRVAFDTAIPATDETVGELFTTALPRPLPIPMEEL